MNQHPHPQTRTPLPQRLFRRLLSISLLCLSAGGLITSSLAKDNAPRKPIDQRFNVEHGAKSIKVGPTGGAKREYAVERKRTGKRLELKLKGKGKRNDGKVEQEFSFSYDPDQGQINVLLGETPLRATINDAQGTVVVGDTSCQQGDTQCMMQASKAALRELTAEQAAAAELVLREQLSKMKGGTEIRTVMHLLADELSDTDL